ncbi:MAG TPA: hypothetical protein PLG79_13955 [Spirochaetales bacterium]|nr:hypothetical protein [Spirochaetales bacterium]
MYHPKLVQFEERLKTMFDEIDHYLEDKYGKTYPLHPSRPERGMTANPQADGLFNMGADFTPGFGSDTGRGYLIDVTMATLETVEETVRREILEETARKVSELLPLYFPERTLRVVQDGNHFKIQGDFGLGTL